MTSPAARAALDLTPDLPVAGRATVMGTSVLLIVVPTLALVAPGLLV